MPPHLVHRWNLTATRISSPSIHFKLMGVISTHLTSFTTSSFPTKTAL